nr:MAG TPA: hypothetical protein [Caudoviricetes sp.]
MVMGTKYGPAVCFSAAVLCVVFHTMFPRCFRHPSAANIGPHEIFLNGA